jgi:hypothetical protein
MSSFLRESFVEAFGCLFLLPELDRGAGATAIFLTVSRIEPGVFHATILYIKMAISNYAYGIMLLLICQYRK